MKEQSKLYQPLKFHLVLRDGTIDRPFHSKFENTNKTCFISKGKMKMDGDETLTNQHSLILISPNLINGSTVMQSCNTYHSRQIVIFSNKNPIYYLKQVERNASIFIYEINKF